MDNSNDLREKLHRELKNYYGSITEIARRHNCHRNWVHMVLRGKSNDDSLLVVAAEVLKERKESRERAEALIQQTLTA